MFPTIQRCRSSWRSYKSLVVALIIVATYFGLRTDKEVPPKTSQLPVPNVVHFVHFINREDGKHGLESETLDFISATSILAVFINHNPDKLVYHTNVPVDATKSKLWSIIFRVLPKTRLEIRNTSRPTHVFGQRLTSVQVWLLLGLNKNTITVDWIS